MKYNISVKVSNIEQLNVVKNYPVDMIYSDDLEIVLNNLDIYYETPIVYDDTYEKTKKLLISDVGLLHSKDEIVSNYQLNVANLSTVLLLLKENVKKVCLSLELNPSELRFMGDLSKYPVEYYLYGRPVVMNLKSHPLFNQDGYTIKNASGIFPIKVEDDGLVKVMHKEVINRIDEIDELSEFGIKNFRVDFTYEKAKEVKDILDKLFK